MKSCLTLCCLLLICGALPAQSTDVDQRIDPAEFEALQIAVQKICPVSGEELGSMGKPIKVKIGKQVAYLCCKSCQSLKIDPEHWTTIQTRIAAAQATCPIMDKPVDSKMESTVIEGQRIFVCCPPCIEKMEKEPKTALAAISKSYTRFVATENQARSDELHALAQAICPVSGEPLDAKGKPIKVKVGEKEHAFLCCKTCVGKKISSEHWKTIQDNLAKAQGTCPIMEKPVDSSDPATVVQGRKIFVCCPPCIEKINNRPTQMIAKLNEQIEASLNAK